MYDVTKDSKCGTETESGLDMLGKQLPGAQHHMRLRSS